MKLNVRSLTFHVFLLATCFHSCTCSKHSYEAVRSDEFIEDNSARYRYRANEILVMYKGTPSEGKRDTIRQALQAAGISDSVRIRTCDSCHSYVELWQAANIHTVIHEEGILAGTVSGRSRGVGEDTLARYSMNYIQHIPVEPTPIRQYSFRDMPPAMSGSGKDTVIIAVLDTGIDTTKLVRSQYLWKNTKEKSTPAKDDDNNCYKHDVFGWNFIDSSANVRDDNPNLHGTLISQFIISEFEKFPGNFPQIMSLKTHDGQGRGDLFSAICALHYALDKGANIINASWGFYYYHDNTHPYLDSLITKVMREKGVLFVTAAGNKIDEIDAYAQASYEKEHGVTLPDSLLRNLEIHNFYPASLAGESNNVMVATTTDGTKISPTQNYSSRFVDFGVMADTIAPGSMKFQLPFTTNTVFISGSSFATAIVTGKVGALARKSSYQANLNKQDIIDYIQSGGSGVVQTSGNLQSRNLVRDGRYIKRE